ncbi:MAG: ATP-binding protein [Elusimicrobia bacterium]|nr:ATP-binding protein [Elusimicrobiota bacterium]
MNTIKIVEDVLAELKMDIKKADADIKTTKNFPEIYCDPTKIKEVFRNLIANGLKFTSNTEKRPEIEIGYKLRKKEVEFFVKDNGIGIKKEFQEKIFEIFRKLHPVGEYEGTGIGLANVKKIINEHKGKITIESKDGEGSTFYFTIPLNLKEKNIYKRRKR